MVESDLAKDEGNALKNERGQRLIGAAQQAAEWERVTKKVDAGRLRCVRLPPCRSPRPSAGDVTSLPLPLCQQCGCSPICAEGAVLCETLRHGLEPQTAGVVWLRTSGDKCNV